MLSLSNLLFLFATLFFLSFRSEQTHSLFIEIKGVSNIRGNVYVGIYREQDNFPKHNSRFKGQVINPSSSSVECVFDKLAPGRYAVAGFLDENNNGRLDKNALGVPIEKYAISNDVRERFSAPSFDKAAVLLNSSRKIKFTLKYHFN